VQDEEASVVRLDWGGLAAVEEVAGVYEVQFGVVVVVASEVDLVAHLV